MLGSTENRDIISIMAAIIASGGNIMQHISPSAKADAVIRAAVGHARSIYVEAMKVPKG